MFVNTPFSRNHKAFAYGSSANIIFSKLHLSKMVKLGGFLPFSLNPHEIIRNLIPNPANNTFANELAPEITLINKPVQSNEIF